MCRLLAQLTSLGWAGMEQKNKQKAECWTYLEKIFGFRGYLFDMQGYLFDLTGAVDSYLSD